MTVQLSAPLVDLIVISSCSHIRRLGLGHEQRFNTFQGRWFKFTFGEQSSCLVGLTSALIISVPVSKAVLLQDEVRRDLDQWNVEYALWKGEIDRRVRLFPERSTEPRPGEHRFKIGYDGWLPGASKRGTMQHGTIVDNFLALDGATWPPYVFLEIVDWLPEMERYKHIKKIRLIEKLVRTVRAIRAKRSVSCQVQSSSSDDKS